MSRFLNTKTHKNADLVLDLEAVTAYHTVYIEDQRRVVMVYQGPAAFTLSMSFEDFDKIFQQYQQQYQASKIFPGYPGVLITPVDPPAPTEPYAPTETSSEIIWTGESDTTTTIRFNKEEKK